MITVFRIILQYYRDAGLEQEYHVENVFQIVSSRVTGYNSSKWDEGLQLALSIVRLWNGALTDTKNAIDRNTNLDSAITYDTKHIKWAATDDYTPPSITSDTYNEAQVPAEGNPNPEATQGACAANAHGESAEGQDHDCSGVSVCL